MTCRHLLLEVTPLLLVNEHQVEVVAHRELLVDVPPGRRQLVTAQKQPYRDGLACPTRNSVVKF